MVRLSIVAALALAVALPTALLQTSHAATQGHPAYPRVYSVQQVLRVFRAQGVTLVREPIAAKWGYDEFASRNASVSVNVYRASGSTGNTVYAYTTQYGQAAPPPEVGARGNLSLVWSRRANSTVRAALAQLRYSTSDSRRALPPTFLLRPGQARTIRSASDDQVDCIKGSSDEAETPADLTGVYSGSYTDGTATLRFTRPTSSTIAFVCA